MDYNDTMFWVSSLGVLFTAIGVTWQIATTKKNKETTNQKNNIAISNNKGNTNIVTGSNNINNDTKININIKKNETEYVIDRFEGQIQPLNKQDYENDTTFNGHIRFNNFMLKNNGKIIYLDIWPYYTDEDECNHNFNRFDELTWFSVLNEPYNAPMGGVEYNIKASDESDFYYDLRPSSRRIYGYFKVIGIQGPQMGFMSVLIKPVNIETAHLLEK